jgi:hypothetical protein
MGGSRELRYHRCLMTNRDQKQEPEVAPEATPETSAEALGPLDFATFVLSLGSSAMVHLGRIPAPGGSAPQLDLPAAKQIIDMLGMLEEKTRGNLDESEERLLQSLLYDLRVQYVDAQQK